MELKSKPSEGFKFTSRETLLCDRSMLYTCDRMGQSTAQWTQRGHIGDTTHPDHPPRFPGCRLANIAASDNEDPRK